jgi:PAS domain S-box-containing protein
MSPVSCQVSAWLLDHLERQGLPPEALAQDLGIPAAELRDPTRRMEWDSFAALCEHLEGLLGDPEALRAAARGVTLARLRKRVSDLAPRFRELSEAYRFMVRWVGPALFPTLRWSSAEAPAGRFELHLEIPDGDRSCPGFFAMLGGALEGIPGFLGQPPAAVETETDGRRAVFSVSYPLETGRTVRPSIFEIVSELTSDYHFAVRQDPDGGFTREWFTDALKELTGYESHELPPLQWERIVHPDDRDRMLKGFERCRRNGSGTSEFRIRARNGELRWVQFQIKVVSDGSGRTWWYGAGRDVSARKRTEEELRESQVQLHLAQKLDAIGRLAGGVAHDFNNLLTAIGGYGELLVDGLGPGHPLRGDAEEILRAAEQASDLTNQLLAFSRRQLLQPRVVDLGLLARDIDRLLRRLLGRDVDLVMSLDAECGPVKVDPGQIEQILVNLAVNARDAMPEGGRLNIATGSVRVPANGAQAHPGVPPGEWSTLVVGDTGEGIDADTLDRIFEPFFTTKERGKGTGLGLATVYGIVQQSEGQIRVASRPGAGTTFTVYLPRAEESTDPAGEAPIVDDLRGDETLLLVEDTTPVRRLLRRSLERHGYAVIAARSGTEALRLLRQHPGGVDLLVTDMVLPQMDGSTLARHIVQEHPGTPVLFITGYSGEALPGLPVLAVQGGLLQKPFSPTQLLRRIRDMLGPAQPLARAAR